MSNGTVLLLDNLVAVGPLADLLDQRRIAYKIVRPIPAQRAVEIPKDIIALVYEPFFALGDNPVINYRDALFDALRVLRGKGVTRIAFSSQDEDSANDDGFLSGEHYDHYFSKLADPRRIVSLIAD